MSNTHTFTTKMSLDSKSRKTKNPLPKKGAHHPLPWRQLTRGDKHREALRYLATNGGLAITVHLSEPMEKSLRSKSDPSRVLSKLVNEELLKHDYRGVPMILILEAKRPDGTLHLHGAYLPQRRDLGKIQDALRNACGRIAGRSGARQFMKKILYCADGWHNYLLKDQTWTLRQVAANNIDHLSWVSRDLQQLSRNDYESRRLGKIDVANTSVLAGVS